MLKPHARMNEGVRPYVFERMVFYIGAVGRFWVLFLRLFLFRKGKVEPAAALAHLPQAWMVAFAEVVEIALG